MQNPHQVYQRQSIMQASPAQLVVKMYDLAIQATWNKDAPKVRNLLTTLINGLDFDQPLSGDLFELYRYCQDLTRNGELDQVRELLEPLRESWEEVARGQVGALS
ncbi:MAG: flagellar export chaperone FliS [Balneolaceae bacterium]